MAPMLAGGHGLGRRMRGVGGREKLVGRLVCVLRLIRMRKRLGQLEEVWRKLRLVGLYIGANKQETNKS